jgi:O-antigen ligase
MMGPMHRTVVFWGLLAVLLFVPLPLGSVEEWAIFVFEAATLALFLVFIGGEFLTGRRAERGPALPAAVKVLLGVFLVLSIAQLIPLPPGLVRVLSPKAAAIYAGLARDGLAGWEGRSFWPLSLSPLRTAPEMVLIACYGIFGYLVLRTVRTRRRTEAFVLVVLISVLFQAFYGMAETFSGSERIFGYQKRFNIGSVTGTYINRNHFAGLMEMVFPLSLGYLLARARYFLMEKGLGWRQRLLWFGQESLQRTLLFGLATVFIGLALVFSKSRSGVLILIVTVVLAAAAAGGWRDLAARADERRRARGVVRFVAAALLAAALWLGLGPVIERFGELDVTREMRRTFILNTARMTADFPWTGTGKGTYVNVYPMYKKVDDGTTLSYAHNDYLEVAAENGVLGGGAFIAAGLWLFVVLAGAWRKRRDNFAKGVGLGALLGVLALLLHGLSDFNLQIPANAVYFTGLFAMAWNLIMGRGNGEDGRAGPLIGPKGEEGGAGGPAEPGRGAWTTWRTLAGAAAALGLFILAGREFMGFRSLGRYEEARAAARSVQAAFPKLERRLVEATAWSRHPRIARELGRLEVEMARAENEAGREEERDLGCDRAVGAYRAVLDRDPIDSFAHFEMGMTYLLYNYPLMTYADKAKAYFRKALELNPSDRFLNLNILYYYLTAWDGLEAGEREYAMDRLGRLRNADPSFMSQLEQRWKQEFGSTDRLAALLDAIPGPDRIK